MVESQFIRFLIAGGLAAAANYASRFVFSVYVPYPAAITCAFFVGLVTGFCLMRQFVFAAADQPLAPQLVKFVLVNLLALLQTLVVSLLLARWVLPATGVENHREAIGHFFGVIIPIATSFIGHRYGTFRRTRN